jgi:pyruvate dehydrogenase E2 component (dihydrolipoamide acetyltransferase)
MAEIVKMPLMSDTMTEGVISVWHKNVGDKIQSGELLADIETDKATMEFNSPEDGVLLFRADNSAPVAIGAILAIIGKAGEDISALLSGNNAGASAQPALINTAPTNENTQLPNTQTALTVAANPTTVVNNEADSRLKASPLAKSMANASGIDLNALKGSGDDGRIVKRDVESYLLQQQTTAPVPTVQVSVEQPISAPQAQASNEYEDTRISQMRKTIARRLAESKFTAPHFYLKLAVNMDKIMAYRQELNALSPVKISFNDLVVKAVAMALRQHPAINSSWLGDVIRFNKHINIGVAVAVDEGLLVPVLRHADQLSLSQIATTTRELAQQAKDRKLQPADMQGNTFTISNLGMFDIDEFTAIINPPDSCILAVGKINEEVAVVNGEIKIVNRLKLTLSCDHRVVDGATGAKFLQSLKALLEEPIRMAI